MRAYARICLYRYECVLGWERVGEGSGFGVRWRIRKCESSVRGEDRDNQHLYTMYTPSSDLVF